MEPQTPEEAAGLREGIGSGGGDARQRVLSVLVGQRVVVLLVEELETQVLAGRSLQVVIAQRRLGRVQRKGLLRLQRPTALLVRLGGARVQLRRSLSLLGLEGGVVLRVGLLHIHRFATDHVGTALHHGIHTTAVFEKNEAKPAAVALVMMVHYTRTLDLPEAGKVLPEVI